MTTVHFIGKQQDANGSNVYHLTIDGNVYTYSTATDMLTNMKTGDTIARGELPGDMLKAFHRAWDPDAYTAAMTTPPLNEYGIPMASEDPASPLYNPAAPEGEPVELRRDRVTTVDLTDLIAHAMGKEDAK